MLDVAQCRILHALRGDQVDSYVLSESSLFISDYRLIIKTCGSTRLLAALPKILQLAEEYAGLREVSAVYYSRKNFSRPDLQPLLHRSFDREVDYLDDHFEEGAAYCMGSLKLDRWYLYHLNRAPAAKTLDHTLEILMSDMPDDVLEVFTQKMCADGRECTEKAGIVGMCPPGTLIHEELFSPCGYSMNGLIPNSDQYVTIHVTPEKAFSYASFETNQDEMCLYKQTRKVLDGFRPAKLLMTVFANDHSRGARDSQQALWDSELPGYRRTNCQFLKLENDETLVYAHFVRRRDPPSSGSEDEGERSD
ncbi:unnamed protein product, partial [Mesorhabditis spiculigera]